MGREIDVSATVFLESETEVRARLYPARVDRLGSGEPWPPAASLYVWVGVELCLLGPSDVVLATLQEALARAREAVQAGNESARAEDGVAGGSE